MAQEKHSEKEARSNHNADNPGVRIPPPVAGAVLLTGGLYCNSYFGFKFGASPKLWMTLGGVIFTLSALISFLATYSFFKHKTSIIPHHPDSYLIQTGIFKYSRNPIYLAFCTTFISICFWFNAPLALVFLPLFFVWLNSLVIPKEEAYLSRHFGSPYTDYQTRVKRWL